MARGDGKAIKGRTRAKSESQKPRYSKSGVRKMAIGGNPGDMATGGFGTGMSGVAGSVNGNRAAGGNNFGGGLAGSSREGGFGGASSSRAGTSAANRVSGGSTAGQLARLGDNPAAAMTGAGIDSGRAQMLSGMLNDAAFGPGVKSLTPGGKIADRIAPTEGFINRELVTAPGYTPNKYGAPAGTIADPMNAFKRQSTQLAAMASPTGVRGTLGSQYVGSTPSAAPSISAPSAPAGFPSAPRMMSSAQDYASITPGSVSLTPTARTVPFGQSPLGQSLLAKSQQPLTKAQAMALSNQLPPGTQLIGQGLASVAYPQPANYNPSQYNQYNTTIDGYNFRVAVPKSATGTVPGPTLGTYNAPIGGSVNSAMRTGAPAPSMGSNFAAGPAFESLGRGVASPPQAGSASSQMAPRGSLAASSAPGRVSNVVAGGLGFGRQGDARSLTERDRAKRRKRLEEENKLAEDEVTSGTTAMRNGGRADGLSRIKTKGRMV